MEGYFVRAWSSDTGHVYTKTAKDSPKLFIIVCYLYFKLNCLYCYHKFKTFGACSFNFYTTIMRNYAIIIRLILDID